MKQGEEHPAIWRIEDPIDVLTKEHEKSLCYLKRLTAAADDIETRGLSPLAFKDVVEVVQYIDTEIRLHDEKEERFLFPLLLPHLNGSVEEMANDHRRLWREFRLLDECVKDLEEMKIYSSSVRDLVRQSTIVVTLLTEHFMKEDQELFPMVKKVLTKQEYRQLTQDIGAIRRG